MDSTNFRFKRWTPQDGTISVAAFRCRSQSKDDYRRTAVFHAARIGFRDIVEYLLRRVVSDLSIRDRYSASPLWAAVRNGREKVAELLLGFDHSVGPCCGGQRKAATSDSVKLSVIILMRQTASSMGSI
jgi:hypothetical protein